MMIKGFKQSLVADALLLSLLLGTVSPVWAIGVNPQAPGAPSTLGAQSSPSSAPATLPIFQTNSPSNTAPVTATPPSTSIPNAVKQPMVEQQQPITLPGTGTASTPPVTTPIGLITLTQALAIADQQNPQLLAARKNIDINFINIRIANEIPNPQLQVQHIYGEIYQPLGNPQQINLNEQIETGGKRPKRVDAAKSNYLLAQNQFNATRWGIRTQTRQSYADLAAAEANVQAVERQAQLLKVLVNIATKRFNAGAAPKSDVFQAELALHQIDSQRYQAQSQLQEARVHFNTLLGIAVPEQTDQGYQVSDEGIFKLSARKTELVPQPDETLPSLDALNEKAASLRPDLVSTLQQIHVNKDQLRLAKAQRIPDLFLTVGDYYVRNYQDPNVATPDKKFFTSIFVQVGINLPVFHNQQAEIASAKASIDQSSLQALALRKQIQDDVHSAYIELDTGRKNIKLYQEQLIPESANVLRLAQESYQVGKTPLTSVIIAQQADQQIRQSYLQAIIDYQKAWGDLEQAVGTPLQL